MINIQEKAFFTVRDRNHKLRMTKVVAENMNTFYIISIFSMINVQLSAVIMQVFLFGLIKTTFTFDRCSISRYEFDL